MISSKVIYLTIILSFALASVSCAKETSFNKTYKNDHPFWINDIPKGISPSKIIKYTNNIASNVSCADLLDSRYDPKILVEVNSYNFLDKDFKIKFYFNESELYSVSLVALKEVSFPQSLDDAKKYIKFFSDKYGLFPMIEEEKGYFTSKNYIWKRGYLETGIFITMVESDTAVFTLTFTDARVKVVNKKYNTKYLDKCRRFGGNSSSPTKTHHDADSLLPAIPPHPHPLNHINKE